MSYIGNEPPDIGAYGVQSFDGGGTSFTLSKPSTTATVLLFIDGVRQTPVDAYSVSGVTLTTTGTTPAGTDNVTVQFLGDVVDFGEPSDDSVSATKIQDDAVTTDKILDDAVTADKLANSINTEIAANTAKVTNATHTGDVTGATALTIATDAVDIAMLSATGTADATTFLRGDIAWAAAGGDNTPAFLALGVAQTMTHDVGADITMSNELYDTDSAYDTGTYKFTVPSGEAGKYLVYGQVSYNASASKLGLAATTVVKIPDGGSGIGQIYNNSSFKNNWGDAMTCTFTGALDLGVGDTVHINGIADTSDSSTISVVGDQGSDRYYTFWGMHKLIGV